MKTIDEWLDEYAESHQNPVNKLIHWICVPAIFFSIMGLVQIIPFPLEGDSLLHTWLAPVSLFVLLFYLRLSAALTAGMVVFIALCWAGLLALEASLSVLWSSVVIFVVAWIFQFIGHSIEGKKPSFFQDVQFLMIGPLWTIAFLYRLAGVPYSKAAD